jgi:hypothetical protein
VLVAVKKKMGTVCAFLAKHVDVASLLRAQCLTYLPLGLFLFWTGWGKDEVAIQQVAYVMGVRATAANALRNTGLGFLSLAAVNACAALTREREKLLVRLAVVLDVVYMLHGFTEAFWHHDLNRLLMGFVAGCDVIIMFGLQFYVHCSVKKK